MLWIPLLMLSIQAGPVETARPVQQVSPVAVQTQLASNRAELRHTPSVQAVVLSEVLTEETPLVQQASADDSGFWGHLGISSWISMGITAALLIYSIVYRVFFAHGYAGSGRRRNPSRV
jgi:hypothetical protein